MFSPEQQGRANLRSSVSQKLNEKGEPHSTVLEGHCQRVWGGHGIAEAPGMCA